VDTHLALFALLVNVALFPSDQAAFIDIRVAFDI
jgi:hypothetical protein